MTIEWLDIGRGLIAILAFAGVVSGAIVIISSSAKKQNESELRALVDTRGTMIDDLRADVRALESQVAELIVKVQYLEDREIDKIVEGVVQGVVRELR